ncbi:hypothetical protein [Citrobacter freundii]|uniref:hypothetical protein n=1 Tax=Citrobacter freundii TaxID=546 RepID=UPI001866F8BB|nr:hypothetical protein [Citrobacter freundii]
MKRDDTNSDDSVSGILNDQHLQKKSKESEVSTALYILAALSALFFFFAITASSDNESISSWRFPSLLLSIILALIWIGIFIEKQSFFRILWSFSITKIIMSIAISALIIFCTAKSSSIINNVFGIDSSAFPFTRTFLTGFLFFKYIAPLLFVIPVFSLVHILIIIGYYKEKGNYESPPVESFIFSALSLGVIAFSAIWLNIYFDDEKLPIKTYVLAHQLDFNSNNQCENLKNENVYVVYIGSSQDKVLVDDIHVNADSVQSFITSNPVIFDGSKSQRFRVISCQSSNANK